MFTRVDSCSTRVHSCSFVFTRVHSCSDLCGVSDMIEATVRFLRSRGKCSYKKLFCTERRESLLVPLIELLCNWAIKVA